MKDSKNIRWPVFVTVRFSAAMCRWMGIYFKRPEGPSATVVRRIYAGGPSAKRSCQFTFCDDESYVNKYGWSHLWRLDDARALRYSVKRTLQVKTHSKALRTALEKRLKLLDEVLHTSAIDRLAAIV